MTTNLNQSYSIDSLPSVLFIRHAAGISLLARIITASMIIIPPMMRKDEMVSSRTIAASTTVTAGSTVERVDAFVGPTRSRPAKKVMIANIVEIRAIPMTDAQPEIVAGNAGPLIATRMPETIAAETMTTVEDWIEVTCFVILLPPLYSYCVNNLDFVKRPSDISSNVLNLQIIHIHQKQTIHNNLNTLLISAIQKDVQSRASFLF